MEMINKVMAFIQGNMVQTIGMFLFMCIEFWLGKTELVKSGSTLELILNTVKKVLELLKIKKAE